MELLAFKLVVTPTLIVALSLAARHWGPKMGGLLTGLPLASGPVLVFVSLEQGLAFAATAAIGILAGIASVGIFCVTYVFAARHWSWPASAITGVAIFFSATAILRVIPLGLSGTALLTLGVLGLILAALPRPSSPVSARPLPAWDLPGRAVTATTIVLALTAASPALGARLSGLLAPFPAFALVLAGFLHAHDGAPAATLFLRGIVLASFASVTFFVVISLGLLRLGLAPTLVLAIFAALGISWIVYRMDQPPAR